MNKLKQHGYIYLSSPYTHENSWIRHQRWKHACMIAGKLLVDGYVVHCPIAESHAICLNYELANELKHEDWMRKDIEQVKRSDAVFVAMIPGWEESKGVREEIEYAQAHGIPVKYVDQFGELVDDSDKE